MSILAGSHIGLIVEGPGDMEAVPVLLRAYLHSVADYRDLLGKPIRLNGVSKATAAGGIEGYAGTAARRPGCSSILIVVDSDKNCPADFGEELRRRAQHVVKQRVIVSAAERNFEDWLFTSAETLGLGLNFTDGCSGIAEIKRAMKPLSYVKPVHQPKLTARMDIALSRQRSRSFDRLLERFELLRRDIA